MVVMIPFSKHRPSLYFYGIEVGKRRLCSPVRLIENPLRLNMVVMITFSKHRPSLHFYGTEVGKRRPCSPVRLIENPLRLFNISNF